MGFRNLLMTKFRLGFNTSPHDLIGGGRRSMRPTALGGRRAMLWPSLLRARTASRALHLTVADPTRPVSKVRTVPLRKMTLDLHAGGEADGDPGASIDLVLPNDWRDVPHSPTEPPFWVLPWPSGSAIAAHLLKDGALVSRKRCIDMGCGLAPAGLAAALAGASHVVLADKDGCALQCAMHGAAANGVEDLCSVHELDWSRAAHEEDLLPPSLAGSFDVVLASDLFYEDDGGSPLARLLPRLLKPEGGTLLLGLPTESEYRRASQASHDAAAASVRKLREEAGFAVESIMEARGAQLPGMGPEGLAAARRVVLATMTLGSSGGERAGPGKSGGDDDIGRGAGAETKVSPLASHVSSLLTRLVGD